MAILGDGPVFFAGSLATQMLLVHQVAYLVDHGVSALVGATLVGVVGIASVIGKAGWGALSDRVGREPTSASPSAVSRERRVPGARGRVPALRAALRLRPAHRVGYAVTAPLTPAIASDLFPGPRFARIFGPLHLANSLGGALGAWIAGGSST